MLDHERVVCNCDPGKAVYYDSETSKWFCTVCKGELKGVVQPRNTYWMKSRETLLNLAASVHAVRNLPTTSLDPLAPHVKHAIYDLMEDASDACKHHDVNVPVENAPVGQTSLGQMASIVKSRPQQQTGEPIRKDGMPEINADMQALERAEKQVADQDVQLGVLGDKVSDLESINDKLLNEKAELMRKCEHLEHQVIELKNRKFEAAYKPPAEAVEVVAQVVALQSVAKRGKSCVATADAMHDKYAVEADFKCLRDMQDFYQGLMELLAYEGGQNESEQNTDSASN